MRSRRGARSTTATSICSCLDKSLYRGMSISLSLSPRVHASRCTEASRQPGRTTPKKKKKKSPLSLSMLRRGKKEDHQTENGGRETGGREDEKREQRDVCLRGITDTCWDARNTRTKQQTMGRRKRREREKSRKRKAEREKERGALGLRGGGGEA